MVVRTSVALVLLFFYAIVLSLSNTLYFVMLLPLIAEIWRNAKGLKSVIQSLLFLNIFLGMLAISLWLMNDTHLALLIFIRSNLTILFALLLFNKKTAFDIALGFQELKFPPKLVSLLFFVAKFIFSLRKNLMQFKKTLHVRGFLPKTTLFTYKTYANFIGMLFINAFKEAKSLQNLMILRGFCGKVYTLQTIKPISKYEFILSLLATISLLYQKGVIV